jgi:ribosomal protein S18 acetylase RimI-like enzyme
MFEIIPAGSTNRRAALMLLYRHLPPGERERQLAQTLAAVDRGEILLDDLLVAQVGGKPIGAVLAVQRAGGAAFLWPPAAGPRGVPASAIESLLRAITIRLDDAGVLFTQCLLEPDDRAGRDVLTAAGFPCWTDMLLMSRRVDGTPGDAATITLDSVSYNASNHAAFVQTIERTYVGTLDCPALAGLRRGDDALAGHRGTGPFDPALWRLFRFENADVALLLANDQPDRSAREIAYLGVVPEARGRGFGREILRAEISAAQLAGRAFIEVAADANNRYALEVYRSLGFSVQRQLAVHVRLRPGFVRDAK